MNRPWVPYAILAVALTGCGGKSGNNASNPSTPPASGGVPPISGGSVQAPIIVGVGPGQTAAGVDITVPGPAASPAPNAQVLGVAPLGPGGSAFNTGSVIHRGTTMKVLVFGPG